ncbi:uncharacterized protein LODBEIA_P42760 [Lodderomyces beijingensis]|uniref:Uncharacterized protein n=1 Tax=Lodderomyces beijingensis TaxID=1775926 RepID=A0ABP0ZUS3_9ASCO
MPYHDDDDNGKNIPGAAIAVNDANVEKEVLRYMKTVQHEADGINLFTSSGTTFTTSSASTQTSTTGLRDAGTNAGARETRTNPWSSEVMNEFLRLKSEILQSQSNSPRAPERVSVNLNSNAVFTKQPPELSFFIGQLSRRKSFEALSKMTQIMSSTTTTNAAFSRWIWNLFLKIDYILEANECFILRDLAKKAKALKTQLLEGGKDKEPASSVALFTLDMITLLVGTYYRQADLLYNTSFEC